MSGEKKGQGFGNESQQQDKRNKEIERHEMYMQEGYQNTTALQQQLPNN